MHADKPVLRSGLSAAVLLLSTVGKKDHLSLKQVFLSMGCGVNWNENVLVLFDQFSRFYMSSKYQFIV